MQLNEIDAVRLQTARTASMLSEIELADQSSVPIPTRVPAFGEKEKLSAPFADGVAD